MNTKTYKLGASAVRIWGGLIILPHGFAKIPLLFQGDYSQFPDPIGLGGAISLLFAVFAETLCGICLVLGLMTRTAAFILCVNMCAACIWTFEKGMPWFNGSELPFAYLGYYVAALILGAGAFSLDKGLYRKSSDPINPTEA